MENNFKIGDKVIVDNNIFYNDTLGIIIDIDVNKGYATVQFENGEYAGDCSVADIKDLYHVTDNQYEKFNMYEKEISKYKAKLAELRAGKLKLFYEVLGLSS